jgi:ABC-2 type transport system ATP-binding protein
MNAIISAENLTRRFGDFVAVDHLSCEISAGQVIGLLGPNGSGKTTTIRMLLGLLHSSQGSARVMGFDCARQSEQIRARAGYMSQKFALYQEMSVWENLEFYAGVYGIYDKTHLQTVLTNLGLEAVQKQPVGSLSSGCRQRLALAVATAHQPSLLFLDEPTSGVDPLARRSFWDLIYQLVEQGITVLVTTHYMDEAEYCNQVGIMRAGKLLALQPPTRLKQSLPAQVWKVYTGSLLSALTVFEKSEGVLRASLASDHLRLITSPDLRVEQLTALLEANGLSASVIQKSEARMEDVFLTLAQG